MKTEYQKCIDGEFFTADPEMLQIIYRCKRLVRELNDTDMENIPRRHHLLSELFGSMGDNVHVDIDFHCEYGINIHCGNDVIINMNCTLWIITGLISGTMCLLLPMSKFIQLRIPQMLSDVLIRRRIKRFQGVSVVLFPVL